jgi:hypothetical protein
MSALDALPEDQRSVLRLLLEQDKEYADAARLGMSEAKARDHAHAAARRLSGEEDLPADVIDRLLCQKDADPDTVEAVRAHAGAVERLTTALEPLSERPKLAFMRDTSPVAARLIPFAAVTTIMVTGITAGIVVGLTHH